MLIVLKINKHRGHHKDLKSKGPSFLKAVLTFSFVDSITDLWMIQWEYQNSQK